MKVKKSVYIVLPEMQPNAKILSSKYNKRTTISSKNRMNGF